MEEESLGTGAGIIIGFFIGVVVSAIFMAVFGGEDQDWMDCLYSGGQLVDNVCIDKDAILEEEYIGTPGRWDRNKYD